MSQVKKSWVWKYFAEKGKAAVCQICNKEIARSHYGTTSMISHLKSQHNVEDPSKTGQPSTSTGRNEEMSTLPLPSQASNPLKMTSSSILKYVTQKKASLAEILAKCAAGDGFSVRAITNSSALKEYVSFKGFQMPKSPKTVFDMILGFSEKVQAEVKEKIAGKMAKNIKFSIASDEWTDISNLRYLILTLTDSEETL